MKIIAVGFNYAAHNKEIKHTFQNSDPVIFMKPESALLKNGKPFFIPDFSEEIHYETELVIKINRLGKNIAERFAHRYFSEITLGIDFTARDLQRESREKGLPWEIAKAFDGAAAIGDFVPISTFGNVNNLHFHLDINHNTVQRGHSADMIFSVAKIIAYASRFFTLKIGDLIFTGTPAGAGKVKVNDCLQGYVEQTKLLELTVK